MALNMRETASAVGCFLDVNAPGLISFAHEPGSWAFAIFA